VALLALACATAPAAAEVGEVTVAQQYGVSFLPLMIMERDGLIEKHARLAGLDNLKTSCPKVAGPSVMNDGILSGTMHFITSGAANYTRFDPLTISLSHPDAMLALLNNTGGVNAHFATSPFYEQEIKFPGARLVTTSYDILGGRASALVMATTTRFRDANPKVY